MHPEFSNIDRPANPYATVDDGINPMLCHFNPYQGKDMFLDVSLIYLASFMKIFSPFQFSQARIFLCNIGFQDTPNAASHSW